MYNKVIMQGNLTRDIELRYLENKTAIASSGLACNEKYKNKSGEVVENVCFVEIVFFGKIAEVANQYLKKGSKILVDGKLKLEQWEDKQTNAKRSKHTITVNTMEFLDNKGDKQETGEERGGYGKKIPLPKMETDNVIPF